MVTNIPVTEPEMTLKSLGGYAVTVTRSTVRHHLSLGATRSSRSELTITMKGRKYHPITVLGIVCEVNFGWNGKVCDDTA